MKQLRLILLVIVVTIMFPASAYANAGPPIILAFGIHLGFLTWLIGFGEALLLCTFFRTWKFRIFVSMITANFTSAGFGLLLVYSGFTASIMGDVTIENLESLFWTMVYVTFILTMVVEFPFFLFALYGRKWLIPKTAATTFFIHCVSYILLIFFYRGGNAWSMFTNLEVVPATVFEVEDVYDLFYISADGRHVLRSDLAGNGTEIIATLDMDGIPDRLYACPRKLIEEKREGTDKNGKDTVQRVCWESGFDLFVLMNVGGVYEKVILLENFSPRAAVNLWNGNYGGRCDQETKMDAGNFRGFGITEEWRFFSDYWGLLTVSRIKQGYHAYASRQDKEGSYIPQQYEQDSYARYMILTPFIQWSIRNGTHIAGDYGVFLLGKDQICIMDPEKKRIALIARGFGPVVAKPHVEAPSEEVEELSHVIPEGR